MKKILLICCIFLTSAVPSYGFSKNDSCITNKVRLPITKYFTLLNRANICTYDTLKENNKIYCFGYCDSHVCRNLYLLYYGGVLRKEKLFLVEVSLGGGEVGYGYMIFEERGHKINLLNYFEGYLYCIEKNRTKYPDLIVKESCDYGLLTVRLMREGKYYHEDKNYLDIEGPTVTSKNKSYLLKKCDMLYRDRNNVDTIGVDDK